MEEDPDTSVQGCLTDIVLFCLIMVYINMVESKRNSWEVNVIIYIAMLWSLRKLILETDS